MKNILIDYCIDIFDCEHKTAPISSFGFPSIRTPNVGKGRLLLDDVNLVSQETWCEWTKRAIPEHRDLILAREAPAGNVALVPKNVKLCLGQRTVLIKLNKKKISPEFLCYYLLSPKMQHELLSKSAGSTVPHVNVKDIRNLNLHNLPELSIQHSIASILTAYDDLIENNLKRIKLLEELAKRTYEEWFVKFRIDGVALKVNMETGLPERWDRKKLIEVASLIKNTVLPENVLPNTPYIGLEHIPRKSITLSEWETADKVESLKYSFKKGDIFFGKIRPYFHKVGIALVDGIASSDTIILRAKFKNLQGPILQTVFSDLFVNTATQSSNGTKMPRANWDVLKDYPVIIPTIEVLTAFDRLNNSVVLTIENLCRQNRLLKESRDILLPRLMSGKLEVERLKDELTIAAEPETIYKSR